jgi:hypothetical protein
MHKPTRNQLEEIGPVLSLMYLGRIVGLLGTKLRPRSSSGITSRDLDTVREVAHAARWDWRLGRCIGYNDLRTEFEEVKERVSPLLDPSDEKLLIWQVALTVAAFALKGCEIADKRRSGELDRARLDSELYDLIGTAQDAVGRLPNGDLKEAVWDCFDMVKEGLT